MMTSRGLSVDGARHGSQKRKLCLPGIEARAFFRQTVRDQPGQCQVEVVTAAIKVALMFGDGDGGGDEDDLGPRKGHDITTSF